MTLQELNLEGELCNSVILKTLNEEDF